MTFDPTKPVQTRDGRPARIICTDAKHSDPTFKIWALIPNKNGNETPYPFAADGSWGGHFNNQMDLVNVPERTSKFMTLWEDSRCARSLYDDLGVAKRIQQAHNKSLPILELVYEDGEYKETIYHSPEALSQ